MTVNLQKVEPGELTLLRAAKSMLVLHALVVGLSLLAIGASTRSVQAEGEKGSQEPIDKGTCTTANNTIYAEYQSSAECLTYYKIGNMTGVHAAIIFVEGDLAIDERLKQNGMFLAFGQNVNEAVYAFRDEQVPIIILGRPGLYGSTGKHQYRHSEMEYGLVAQGIRQLVSRFELIRVGLVGQSGGSSAIMGALSLGVEDGDCIVLGSGAYDIANLTASKLEARGTPVNEGQKREWQRRYFSHHRSLTGIRIKSSRRFFLVGDPTDSFAPFRQQLRYAESLQRAGHSVRIVEAKAPRDDGHTFVYESLKGAARCLKGANDRLIGRALGGAVRIP